MEGYNLGASADDVVFFSVRGVECLTLRRESSNGLSCVFGDAAVTSDLGQVGGRRVALRPMTFPILCTLCIYDELVCICHIFYRVCLPGTSIVIRK